MSAPLGKYVIDWLASGRRPAPRIAVVFAHPDDETIGAGARLPRLGSALFVCVTDGAPRVLENARRGGFATRDAYATARQEELSTAFRLAAIEPAVCHLGLVDQEASLRLIDLSRRLAELLRKADCEAVITQPYEGGHPDHDATAFGVHSACALVRREIQWAPEIVEMAAYHGAVAGELRRAHSEATRPRPVFLPPGRGFGHRSRCPLPLTERAAVKASSSDGAGAMVPLRFLANGSDDAPEVEIRLSPSERRLKARLFDAYKTQRAVLRNFPLDVERFRLAPKYDFRQPPHTGKLFYENFNWGMNGSRWRDLAVTALEALEIAPGEPGRRAFCAKENRAGGGA